MRRSNIDISFIIIVAVLAFMSLRDGAMTDPMTWIRDKIVIVPAIFIGLTFHEFAHAFVADKLGDSTPRQQGRVTLNPLAHIDWVGLLCLFFVGFGWGQPVQIDPRQFKHPRRDEFLVSIAGVTMNFLLAIVFALISKLVLVIFGTSWANSGFGVSVWMMLEYVIIINLVLMVFNLIPVPPLDGFNILAQIIGFGQTELYWKIYTYGNWILIALIVFGVTGRIISPCVQFLYSLIANIVGLPWGY
ncbi:MAG: site-2 protease family protein [Firmicutes bacterium]|nr:site-2 protease family protein [Bacillota bacterium]